MKIDKNIELPPKGADRAKYEKYPWADMEIGDSFLVSGYSYKKQAMLSACGQQYSNRHGGGLKFATRKEGDGIRVFRIE